MSSRAKDLAFVSVAAAVFAAIFSVMSTPPQALQNGDAADDRDVPDVQQQDLPPFDESDASLGPIYAIEYHATWSKSLAELARKADVVVAGDVVDVTRGRDDGYNVWENIVVEVREQIGSEAVERLTYENVVAHSPTGRPIIIEDQLSVRPGEAILLFLIAEDGPRTASFFTRPHPQGIYKISRGVVQSSGRDDRLIRAVEGMRVADVLSHARHARQ
jgi:hypothetical protein